MEPRRERKPAKRGVPRRRGGRFPPGKQWVDCCWDLGQGEDESESAEPGVNMSLVTSSDSNVGGMLEVEIRLG